MKFYGEAHLQQNNLREAVIPLDTTFPVTPVVGQIVFKDRILYICVEIVSGLPTWVPLTNQITTYTYIQNTDAATWTINHTLNTQDMAITVYDTLNRVVIPGEVTIVNSSQVVVGLGTATQGKVVLVAGNLDGNQAPMYAFEFFQTNPSTSWSIPHNLGRYPIVRIFIGNQEVQPESITFDTVNVVTVTFSTAQVGQAKLI
jgi:hypothetical protein